MKLSERKEVLFFLKHAAELECYGRGGLSKPRCAQTGCDGEHTPNVHELMGEESASVNLVAEDEDEYELEEDEEWWVGTVRIEEVQEEEEETLGEIYESEPGREARFSTSAFTRREDSRLEDMLECLWDAHVLPYSGGPEEDRWWSPEPPQSSSEEDEEEVQYLIHMLGLEPREAQASQWVYPAPEGVGARPEEDAVAPEAHGEGDQLTPGAPSGGNPGRRRRGLRTKSGSKPGRMLGKGRCSLTLQKVKMRRSAEGLRSPGDGLPSYSESPSKQ
jgi:hypothetical protein